MPLLDHFHPPLHGQRHWESFHGSWAVSMASRLNQDQLPPYYFAEVELKVGTRIKVDVATVNQNPALDAPPRPGAVMPTVFPDVFGVRVFSSMTGPTLVAAIELVSPGDKDRDETRRAFAAKCATYLQQGIGLLVVDIVTSRHANLHDDLMALLGHTDGFVFPTPTPLYATAYRPAHREERNEIDLWRESLRIGQMLPTLPLAVRGLGCLPIDLETTYMEARRRGRIG
jgi:hypothetical protein